MRDFEKIPDVLTIPDLQKALRIGRSTAYRLIKANDIRSIRIGRSIRIPKQYVEEYIRSNGIPVEGRRELCYDDTNVTTQDGGLPEERRVK